MKERSTRSSRYRLANLLSQHLQSFGSSYRDIVICPTCLCQLRLSRDQDHFSAGHILPEAAGGKEWTFICRSCNSLFGRKQDKWFGEYLHILNNPKGTLLHAQTKSKYVEINGVTVRADVQVSDAEQSIQIFTPTNENPPGKLDSIKHGGRLKISVKIPLTEHENEVDVGYITAAYLYWFHEIGYNWVFQSSLDGVRRQIMECNRTLDGAKVIELSVDRAEIQGIGVVRKEEHLYPCCVVVDKLVIFPVPPTINAPTPGSQAFTSPCDIQFLKLAILSVPYLTVYDGDHVVVPDRLQKNPPVPEWLFYIHSQEDSDPQWLKMESNI